jgi:chemotaxis protein MotA
MTLTLGSFVDGQALAIVFGGTALALVLRTSARDLARAGAALRTLGRKPFDAGPLLHQIEALTRISARHGVMQLDRSVIADRDVNAGIAAVVDGAEPDAVAAKVTHCVAARAERHRAAIDVWCAAAETLPAMGMVGTLIGLVQMFTAMTDPAAIGGAMAVAVLATLYGALAANLIANPVAARLKRLARAEAAERARLAAPLAALAAREAPRLREVA